ncbi:UNVERIFIED_CONTAM: hypothetical protein Slati_2158700 [Sesamum latifolium]|uniref:Retrotransposon gag domain-containing protein n=1 Tax=Sesamum latifolium TaxID=2727402 RepID=A0AAW2WW75_9LAMI
MHSSWQLSLWEAFTRALELHFGPSTYDNHQATLFKLRRRGTVAEFQAEFKRLGNHIVGLPPEALLNCCIFGFQSDIQRELVMLQPLTFSQAFGLAKLLEVKANDPKSISAAPNPLHLRGSCHYCLFPPPNLHCLSAVYLQPMQARRAHGVCFNCDEKFSLGHRCKAKHFLLLLPEDDDPRTAFRA